MNLRKLSTGDKILLGIIFSVVIVFLIFNYMTGLGWWYYIPWKEICGGWNTAGESLCECSGILVKPACPPGAVCDSASYYCVFGTCGMCSLTTP